MLAVLCPGQGSQSAGFLAPWLALSGVRERLDALSATAGFDLAERGNDPDADVLDTAVAQPLLVAAALVTADLLGPLPSTCIVAGHSIGELAAAALAGVLTADDAVAVARVRGEAMATAAAAEPSGMTAILGGDADEVDRLVEAAGCWIANRNAPGQVVAGGPVDALDQLAAAPPTGSRLRRLAVAGAFHTPLMASAREAVEAVVGGTSVADPRHLLLSNADGAVVRSGRDFTRRLVHQVTATVRFDACLDTLAALGVTAAIELAPGGVLTALIRRTRPDVDAVALRSPDDVEAGRTLLSQHADGEPWREPWFVAVSPAKGTFRAGASAAAGLGTVLTRSEEIVVRAPHDGRVIEWLAADGDPVSEGQPVVRLVPDTAARP